MRGVINVEFRRLWEIERIWQTDGGVIEAE
jgi:hypothetical protein